MNLADILSLGFVRAALATGLLVGGLFSYVGVLVILRRVVFVGITLAQMAALGVAISFYVHFPPEVTALAATLGGALILSPQMGGRFIPRDAGIAFVYAAASAASILLVAKSALGEAHVLGLLFGNILTVTTLHLVILAVAVAVVALVHLLFHREFLFASFDPETARASGFRVGGWNALFDLTLAVSIAVAIHEAGALLVFSYLVQPALFGLLVARRLRSVVLVAFVSTTLVTFAGVVLSVVLDLPTGPTVVAGSSFLVLAGVVYRRLRG